MKDKNVISIVPQLLCGQLARQLGSYIESEPNASPAEMLVLCNQILDEIGAVKDENGVWRMPDEGVRS